MSCLRIPFILETAGLLAVHLFATFANRVALSTAKLMVSHSFAAAVQFQ